MDLNNILVIGANGQLGTELLKALRSKYGNAHVTAADIREPTDDSELGGFVQLDVLNKAMLQSVIQVKKIKEIYLLAAMLSATGEKHPELAWQLNMQGLLHVLELAKCFKIKVFWPSSIAVFGDSAPKQLCPQDAPLEPATVYGISKAAGELWCKYYYEKYQVDVRSIRYPGLISYSAAPGGGTTDYAVEIFHAALETGSYTCFLNKDTVLPMMYMPDAVRATIELMNAPADFIRIRTSYNLQGISFTPAELAATIRQQIPYFKMDYAPDFRQAIADSWPQYIDDRPGRTDWGWAPYFDLKQLVADMLLHLQETQAVQPLTG